MKTRDGSEPCDDWQTPPELYEHLNMIYSFDFDPCPLFGIDKKTGQKIDGLSCEWGARNFVNPPYNRVDKPKFIARAIEEQKKGKQSVLLIPAATGTKDFHRLAGVGSIYLLRGRIKFLRPDGTRQGAGKHDSMIVVLRPDYRAGIYSGY